MRHVKIAVIGGAGFVGRHLANALVEKLREVIVVTRVREHAKSLIMLPLVQVVEADGRDAQALTAATRGADAVVNLVGVLYESSRARFDDEHVGVTEAAIEACRRNGIRRFIQMSALNADTGSESKYLRSKGEAEAKVVASGLDWTIFRPSLIIGPEDRSLNAFAAIVRWMPVVFLPGASAKFQPIYVGDVVKAFVAALDDHSTFGQRYPLCGPRVLTLRELFAYAARLTGRRRVIIGTPGPLAALQAGVLELMPGKPMTRDNLKSMRVDSVSDGTPTFLLGGPPRAIEDIVPLYLAPPGEHARYFMYRRRHH